MDKYGEIPLEEQTMDDLLSSADHMGRMVKSIIAELESIRAEIGRRSKGSKKIVTELYSASLEYNEPTYKQSILRQLAETKLGKVYIRVSEFAVNKSPSGSARLSDLLDGKAVLDREAAEFAKKILEAKTESNCPPRIKITRKEG